MIRFFISSFIFQYSVQENGDFIAEKAFAEVMPSGDDVSGHLHYVLSDADFKTLVDFANRLSVRVGMSLQDKPNAL